MFRVKSCKLQELKSKFYTKYSNNHTGQYKRTDDCYNELVVAFFSTCGGVKGKKISIPLFVMTPGAQTTGNIAVYGSAKQLVI